jgi:hypothetical protein
VVPGAGVIFVVIGGALWRLRHHVGWAWRGPLGASAAGRSAFAGLFLGFAVVWTVGASIAVVGPQQNARRLLENGEARVVEGEVRNFHPMPAGGHDTERFAVGGVQFAYSEYAIGPGFRHTSAHGGPMREGLPVRIHYSGEPQGATILKLEIKE